MSIKSAAENTSNPGKKDDGEFEVKIAHGVVVRGHIFNPQASGAPLLALHGWLDNLHSFLPLVGVFEKRKIYALDMPGHGKSDHKPPGYLYHFIDTVYDVISLADALGFDRFGILGHSMGAGVGALVAGTVPHRVESLVLIDGLGPLSRQSSHSVESLRSHLRQVKRLPYKKFPVYKNLDEALAARLAVGDLNEAAGRLIVERGVREVDGGITWSSDARLRVGSAHPFTEEQVLSFIEAIACPSLFVRATPGYPFDKEVMRGRCAALKGLMVREIEGAHHVHMDQPEQIAAWMGELYGG